MEQLATVRILLQDVIKFAALASGLRLRAYQVQVARAVINSVQQHLGLTFVVIFPRQSGKNELQAQIETFIMTVLSNRNTEIVKVSPTWKPQAMNAMRQARANFKKELHN